MEKVKVTITIKNLYEDIYESAIQEIVEMLTDEGYEIEVGIVEEDI